MAEFEMGCDEIIVINPPELEAVLETPGAPSVTTDAPPMEIEISGPPPLSVEQEAPDSTQVVVPVLGIPGAPGSGSGDPGAPVRRYTYISPAEQPNGSRTTFTVPFPYVLGTLAVYLNGLQENFISQLTTTTFSFDTAPYSTDTIKVEFDALI